MADFFTSAFFAPVDKAASQKARQTEINTTVDGTNQSTETAQLTKTSGSNFSMCEIIM
ncbi:hypothetical protein B0J17DRAFT_717956 [Rhizoctonia solani]|nr:hypothetical protein B0J17DRAFT_717956 [Rhizoctonia solani]